VKGLRRDVRAAAARVAIKLGREASSRGRGSRVSWAEQADSVQNEKNEEQVRTTSSQRDRQGMLEHIRSIRRAVARGLTTRSHSIERRRGLLDTGPLGADGNNGQRGNKNGNQSTHGFKYGELFLHEN
jgi:hypothetical protein